MLQNLPKVNLLKFKNIENRRSRFSYFYFISKFKIFKEIP